MSESIENLRGLLTGGAGRPASAPVVTAGAASAAPVLPQQPAQQETSLLEQLRQSLQRDLTPGPMTSHDRLATFGRGVLSNRGSFLDNLSAGLAAQNQAEAGRREEGRKALELQAEIARRDEELRLKQEELRDPSIRELRAAQAEYYRRRPEMAASAAGMRGRLTDAQYAAIRKDGEQLALRRFPDPTPGMPDPDAAKEKRRMDREAFVEEYVQKAMLNPPQSQGAITPPAPTQPRQQVVPVPLTGAPRPAPTER